MSRAAHGPNSSESNEHGLASFLWTRDCGNHLSPGSLFFS